MAIGQFVTAITRPRTGRCHLPGDRWGKGIAGSNQPGLIRPKRGRYTMSKHEQASAIREMTENEVDTVSGGFDLGPIHAEAGGGLAWIGIGGYGIWVGEGCVGVTTPDKVVGVCAK